MSIAAFAIMHLAPGDPTTAYAHSSLVSGDQAARVRQALGLDQPLPIQYLQWLGGVLRGDWGRSYADGRPVLAVIAERAPATILLMTAALTVAIALAAPLGVLAATRPDSRLDHLLTFGSFFAWAMPLFWLGLMAQFVFAVQLRLVPVAEMRSTDGGGPADVLHHLLLPAAVLGLSSVAPWSRYLRSSLLEAIRQPYVTTALAKGGSARRAVLRHALPNALLPIVTLMGLELPALLTGSVVTETVFAWPGMGRLFWESLGARDYPVEMGLLVIAAAAIILGNLAADLVSAAIDPRIRLGTPVAA